MKKIVPDPPHTLEEALLRACDVLRCAAASAYESGEQLGGSKRHLAFSVVYLIDLARALVEQSLMQVEQAPSPH